MVLGAEMLGHAARVLELVERRLVEADRERLHRAPDAAAISADDEARVDAAGEERAERHVADQVRADGVARAPRAAARRRPLPIRRTFPSAGTASTARSRCGRRCHVSRWPGGSLRTSLEDRPVARRVEERQVVIERVGIELARQVGRAEQRLDLGAEIEAAARPCA